MLINSPYKIPEWSCCSSYLHCISIGCNLQNTLSSTPDSTNLNTFTAHLINLWILLNRFKNQTLFTISVHMHFKINSQRAYLALIPLDGMPTYWTHIFYFPVHIKCTPNFWTQIISTVWANSQYLSTCNFKNIYGFLNISIWELRY